MTQKVVKINRNKLDSSKVVFPIGKIKGRNVYELMQNEPDKLKWFVNQPFFKEKHADIYNIIINGSNEIKDSKEHNEIVQLFYNWDFLFKLFLYLNNFKSKLEFDESVIEDYLNDRKKSIKNLVKEYKLIYKYYLYAIDYCNELNTIYDKYEKFLSYNTDLIEESYTYLKITDTKSYLNSIKNKLSELKNKFYKLKDELKLTPELIIDHTSFSRKIYSEYLMNDIVLKDYSFISSLKVYETNKIHTKEICKYYNRLKMNNNLKFEIKPLVGEDYPEILRQCKRQNTDVLIIKQFYCESTSLEVVRQMFDNIEIIVLEDIININY